MPTPSTYNSPQYQNALNYSNQRVTTGNRLFDMMNAPGYTAAYDPNQMSLTNYLGDLYGQNSEGYNQFKEEALRKGPSSWLNMNLLAGDLQEQTQREGAQRESNAATAGAMDKIASSGGMSSGARERAAESGAKNYLGMSQDLQRQGNMNDLNMRITDEGNRINMMTQLPGMEQNRVSTWEQARQADINNQMQEVSRLNQYNQDLYKSRLEAAAAERQARATENSGKK